jgi:thiamine biosynthesis protein ThiS
MIELIVNGKKRELEGPTNLMSYLESLEINLKLVAVAVNGTVVRKNGLSEVTLTDGDEVEIVRAVGGG